jgi:hypothetical protein
MASLAPAASTMCSDLTGWIGWKWLLKNAARASRSCGSPLSDAGSANTCSPSAELRDTRKECRLTDLTRDLVFHGALEEFEKFRSKDLVLRAREIDSGGGIVVLGWGCGSG